MKYIIIIICSLFAIRVSATEITLAEAIKNKNVECVITGNSASTHYFKPIKIKIKNLKSGITIRIDYGLIFNAIDTAYQDIVVTQQMMAELKPGQSKTLEIYGMCIKEHNSAPADEVSYKAGSVTDGDLKKMSLFIEQKKYFNQCAQQAVWVIRGSRDINELCGFDGDGWEDIVKFTASLLNVAVPERPKEEDYQRNYYTRPTKHVIKGSFTIEWPQECKATVGIFNKQGIIVREIYNNPKHPAGLQKVSYEFDASQFTDPAYDLKMIIDGEVFINKEVKILGRE
jgi:hypothetical protein